MTFGTARSLDGSSDVEVSAPVRAVDGEMRGRERLSAVFQTAFPAARMTGRQPAPVVARHAPIPAAIVTLHGIIRIRAVLQRIGKGAVVGLPQIPDVVADDAHMRNRLPESAGGLLAGRPVDPDDPDVLIIRRAIPPGDREGRKDD
ncbi:MAG TPA: hypothetical protein VF696_02740 [Candidatus Paceibacterota bacterium]